MAGFVNGPPAAQWGVQRCHIGGTWPTVLVDMDLRYWADPIACARQVRPSIRILGDTWGWKKTRVADYVKAADSWRTLGGQVTDNWRTLYNEQRRNMKPNPDTCRTPAGQSADSDRTPPIDTRARTSPSPSPSPSRKTKAVQDPSADWTAAALFWSSEVNPALGRRPAMPSATSKLGVRLAGEIKRNGLDAVLDSFRWLAYGQTWHARNQRARKTVDMWTPLRHVEKWGTYWRDIGDTPDDPADNGKPKEQTFAQRLAAMEQN